MMEQPKCLRTSKHPHLSRLVLVGALLLLVLVGVWGVPRLHAVLTQRVARLQAATIAGIEEVLNRPFEYRDIRPNIIQGITVRDLRVYRDADHISSLAEVGTLRVGYSIWGFLRGELRITRIQVLDARFTLDTRDPAGLQAFIQELLQRETNGTWQASLADTAILSARRLHVQVSDDSFTGDVAVQRATVRSLQSDPQFVLAGAFQGISDRFPQLGGIQGEVAVEGRITDNLSGIDSMVEVDLLETDRFLILDQEFGLQLFEDKVSIWRREARDPIEVQLEYSPVTDQVHLSLQSDGYRLGTLIHFRGDWAWMNQLSDGTYHGSGDLSFDLAAGRVSYDLDLQAVFTDLQGLGPVQADISARGNQDRLQVYASTVRTRLGQFRYTGRVSLQPDVLADGQLLVQDLRYRDLLIHQLRLDVASSDGRIQLRDADPDTSIGSISGLELEVAPNLGWGIA